MSLSEIVQKISVYFIPAVIAAVALIIAGGAYVMLQHKKTEIKRGPYPVGANRFFGCCLPVIWLLCSVLRDSAGRPIIRGM